MDGVISAGSSHLTGAGHVRGGGRLRGGLPWAVTARQRNDVFRLEVREKGIHQVLQKRFRNTLANEEFNASERNPVKANVALLVGFAEFFLVEQRFVSKAIATVVGKLAG
jgi:hypothetical protein